MKRQIGILMAVWLITSAFLRADTSYLLFQGPFGSGSSEATYKWQFNYPTGALVTSQDLLDSLLGNPVAEGAVQNDPVFGGLPYYVSGNSTFGATYASYGPGIYVALSFTIDSVTVDTNDFTPAGTSTQGWNYYVAGGTGDGAIFTPPSTYSYGAYPSGAWNFSNDGTDTRFLSDGSFDGWLYGNTGSDVDYDSVGSAATVNGADNTPIAENFTGATVINVPEPGSLALLAAGAMGLGMALARNRKRTG